MKPSTVQSLGHQKLTSTGTSDVQSATIPKGTSMIAVTVETNPGRMTWDGTDPTGGVGPIAQNGVPPWHLLIGQGAVVKWVSTVAGSAVLQLSYLQ